MGGGEGISVEGCGVGGCVKVNSWETSPPVTDLFRIFVLISA